MGTSNGLCRYDGKDFKYFSDRRMKDKEIINLEIDSFDHIWFRNLSNQLFCILDGKIITFNEMTNDRYGPVNIFGILENASMLYFYKESQYVIRQGIKELT